MNSSPPRTIGLGMIAGIDEVGRGPLAGPVVAACCAFEKDYQNSRFRDSKTLSLHLREQLAETIREQCPSWALISLSPWIVDRINIRQATRLAMFLAASAVMAEHYFVDGNMPIHASLPHTPIIKGDRSHFQISAASILAKVWRDQEMTRLDSLFPGYGLAKHAGYPTELHRKALQKQGPSPIHRQSFKGVREFLGGSTAGREGDIGDQEYYRSQSLLPSKFSDLSPKVIEEAWAIICEAESPMLFPLAQEPVRHERAI